MPSADGLRQFSVDDLIVARFRRERMPFGGTAEWNKPALTFSPRNYDSPQEDEVLIISEGR